MKFQIRVFLVSIIALSVVSCQQGQNENDSENIEASQGIWRGAIALNDSIEVPFNFDLKHTDSSYSITIYNAEEEIVVEDVEVLGDSLKFTLPVFANYIIVEKGEKEMRGKYVRPDAEDYVLDFTATYGDSLRFETSEPNCCDINEKWRVQFYPDAENETPAIAYFEQKGTYVEGTFMTQTGDYRYLQGVLSGDNLQLSAFDGVHLFYVESEIKNGQEMEGLFYSGRSLVKPWRAFRDDDFELSDPDTLTYLKEGYETVDFNFPDLEGDTLSLSDPQFEGKPVIIQIMGSWCPNCMDESRYLRNIYEEYHDEGLEIVGLTFERVKDRETAIKRAKKMKGDLGLPYPILLAGATRHDKADEALPMLNHIMSFPTTIYLDRNHKVVKIHTGFSGPGTPVWDEFVAKNKSTIEDLVRPVES